jgi:hypothetical protein
MDRNAIRTGLATATGRQSQAAVRRASYTNIVMFQLFRPPPPRLVHRRRPACGARVRQSTQ